MGLNSENKRIIDAWNEKYPKGTEVRYYYNPDDIEEYERTYTKSKAYLTYLPYPVILLDAHVKLVLLNQVKPIIKEQSEE